MNYDDVCKFVQSMASDGLVVVVGSGLSAAEGIPGMGQLAGHLSGAAKHLSGGEAAIWKDIQMALDTGEGLEAALLKHVPSATLEEWIATHTAKFMLPIERAVIGKVVSGATTLRLTKFLRRVHKHPAGLPIVTTNYDRLAELAAECAGLHVDTTAVGQYLGSFDHKKSLFAACTGVSQARGGAALSYLPRAIVLKPHGSFDWYRSGTNSIRCAIDLDAERLIITPGLNKYKAGYSSPFDKHRDLANERINAAARLVIVGYGFNDDHLQVHLVKKINDGTPTLIVTHTPSAKAQDVATTSPKCLCLSKASTPDAVAVLGKGVKFERQGADVWDIGKLAEEILA